MATLGEYIGQQVREAIDGALQDSESLLTDVAVAGGNAAAGGLVGTVSDLTGILKDLTGILTDLEGLFDPATEVIGTLEGSAGIMGRLFAHGYLLGFVLFRFLEPTILPVIHAIAASTTNEIFDPDTAAQLAARGLIPQRFAESEAAGGGLDSTHEDALIESHYTWPSLSEILTMANRSIITWPQAQLLVQRAGYPPDWRDSVVQLAQAILSPADLALAALRGELPADEAAALAAKAGYTADQFNILMLNTGEPPGLMQLLEAYRRDFIDKATLEHGIRQSRVRDEWIPTVEKLRFSPMSVADAVRAVVEKYIPQDEGQAIAEQNGLEPGHFPILVESWGRPLAMGEMLSLLNRGIITEDQVKEAIRQSDIKDEYVDTAIHLRRRLIPEWQLIQMVQEGVIVAGEAVVLLQEQGYTPEDADRIIALGVAKRTGTSHVLTESETIQFYTDGIINRQQAHTDLIKMGYKDDVAKQLLDLADFKKKTAIARIELKGVEAQFKAGDLDRASAIVQLEANGLDAAQARANVDEWQQSMLVRERRLTPAQVLKATKDGIMSLERSGVLLGALGYSQNSIDVLFKLEGFIPYTPIPLPDATTPSPTTTGTLNKASTA